MIAGSPKVPRPRGVNRTPFYVEDEHVDLVEPTRCRCWTDQAADCGIREGLAALTETVITPLPTPAATPVPRHTRSADGSGRSFGLPARELHLVAADCLRR